MDSRLRGNDDAGFLGVLCVLSVLCGEAFEAYSYPGSGKQRLFYFTIGRKPRSRS
jgi:hypothetical protein